MFYITVSNGLLKDGHRKRMGAAVWEFMWCIDKITKIDENGVGHVLGGKPIKLDEIAEQLEVHRDTVSENLKTLEDQGYIQKIHAPYGIVIRVIKAKKRFGENALAGSAETPNLRRENAEPNKTVSVDSSSKTITPLGSEALNFNKKLFEDFKEVVGESPMDAPNDRIKYPRLIRQKLEKLKLPPDTVRQSLRWACGLINKRDGQPYWRGKLKTLGQVYYKILPGYIDEVKAGEQRKKLFEMKNGLATSKQMFSATDKAAIQQAL